MNQLIQEVSEMMKVIEGYRLSPEQEHLWSLLQSDDEVSYSAQGAIVIEGLLDRQILANAIRQLVDRHESLRTNFHRPPGVKSPLQIVTPSAEPICVFLEISEAHSHMLLDDVVDDLFQKERAWPVDLSRDSPLRLLLVAVSSRKHLLIVTLPALCADGATLENLARELSQCYGICMRAGAELEDVAQYPQFSEWQNELLEGDDSHTGRHYWLNQNWAALAALRNPLEQDPERPTKFKAAAHNFTIDHETTARIRAIADELQVSIGTFLLTCWHIFLWRLTGQSETMLGILHHGRSFADLAGLLGLCDKWLPVSCKFHDNSVLSDLLKQVHRTVNKAAEWPEYFTWEDHRSALAEDELFISYSFELHEEPTPHEVEGLKFLLSRQAVCFDRFKLKLTCVPEGEILRAELAYDTQIFRGETIEHIASYFGTLVESAAAHPESPASELSWLSVRDQGQIELDWNITGKQYPRTESLHSLFEAQAARTPAASAIKFENQELNYGELNLQANRVANNLRRRQIGPGALVCLYMERSLEMVIAILGVLKAGAAYVPIDPAYPTDRVSFMLGDTRAEIILTQSHLRPDLPPCSAPIWCLDAEREVLIGESQENPVTGVSGENLAYVMYTSGSTGKPKGVMIPHRAIVNHMFWLQDKFPLTAADTVLQKTPFSFDASVWELFAAFLVGGKLVVARPAGHQDSAYLVKIILKEDVSTLQVVPSLLQVLLEERALEECKSLRRVFCGGEALSRGLQQRFSERLKGELINLYGPTEAAINAACWTCRPEDNDHRVPIGRPGDNMKIYILDRQLRHVPVGTHGDLHIGGAGLAHGYLNRPDLTGEKFIPNPFGDEPGSRLYKTGDITRYHHNGTIEFVNRRDHQVKIRGYRIELGEIEAALRGCPSVRECIVDAQETQLREKRLVAYVVPLQRPWPSGDDLRTFLELQLPQYMVPVSFVLLDVMPLMPNGKLDRSALEALAASLESESSFVAPRTPVEEVVTGLWREVLGVSRLGIHDNFFELGGHSLLATQLISHVNEVFAVEVPLRTLFESPTVAALSSQIEESWGDAEGLRAPPILPRTHDDGLPLSFAQQRLWFLDQLEPGAAFYNIPVALRLTGRLNVAALERALNEIVRRHEALRTAFPSIGGRPAQIIMPAIPMPLPRLDLSALSESEREVETHQVLTEEAAIKFLLSEGPLLRVKLIREREEEHVLLVTMHHIVSDGWSIGVMVQELGALYRGYAAGGESELGELGVQYGDYAEWQRGWLQGEVLEGQLAYWREQLAGLAVLELPTDYGRPAVQRYRGAHLYETLPVGMERLKAQNQRLGVTLYMSLLAALGVVLSRYSGQTDIAVGTAIAGRNRAETEKLIGLFVNTLVMRTDLSGEPSIGEVLRRVREVCLGGYGHQDVPFERLVEELQPERDLSRSPLYQVMFILQNTPGERLELPGLQVSMLGSETGTAKLDLVLSVIEGAAGLQTHWEYNTDLFAEETIRRLAGHYGRVVAAMVEDEEQLVSEVRLLSEAEAEQLAGWNEGGREYAGRSVVELFEEQVRERGEAVAVAEASGAWVSYGELNQRANQLAEYLRGQGGVRSEEVVGLCVERSIAMVVGMLGILKAGAAYLPLEWQYPAARKEMMVREAGVRVLLTEEALLGAAPTMVQTVFCLDRDDWQLKTNSVDNPTPAAGPDNLAYLIYTSGSSGLPKGVLVSHRNLLSTLQASRETFDLCHTDVMAAITQISFDILLFELFVPLLSGASVLLIPTLSVLDLPQLLLNLERVTIWHSVPSLMRQFVNFLEQGGKAQRLRGLRKIFIGGDAVAGDLLSRMRRVFPNAEINVLYGPTEATIICTSYRVEATSAGTRQIIGTPLPNAQISICDEHGNLVPVGVRGEIFIGGTGVSRGYLNRELTAEKFVPMNGARYYRSGDLGRYLSNGNIEFLGRVDNQVKIRGYRIELSEVETALNSHPSLLDSVVVTRITNSGERQLVGYVVRRPECEPSVSELRNHLKEKLPEYMVPSDIVLLEQLPLTSNGKIDRKALPEPERIKTESAKHLVLPRNRVEETLASVWKEVLGLNQIGVDENFFELGGDSILSIQIVARANQLGLSLTPRLVFQHQTIAELAEVANKDLRVEAEQTIVSGFVPLTPIQQRFFAQDLNVPEHFNQTLLLKVRRHLAPASLRMAISRLTTHHDALRLRFVSDRERGWEQFHAPADEEVPVAIVDLSLVSEERRRSTIEAAAGASQRSLNLYCGPLLRVVYFHLGCEQPARLLLVVHHLVIDGVSWRILLQDLEQIIGQVESGVDGYLPAKTTSFKQWAISLEHAVQDVRDHEEYWQGEQWRRAGQLSAGHDPSVNTVATEQSVHVSLSDEETQRLLQEVPHAYNTQINDVLLTALAKTLCRWSGSSSIILTIEGHGREDRLESVDTTRTIGWFTNIYPVLLQVNQELGAGELLKQIKEQLRLAAQSGWWYDALRYCGPEQQIRDQLQSLPPSVASFNYLGQMDQVLGNEGRFEIAAESCGATQDDSERRAYPLEIGGAVIGGRLQMTWRHSTALHSRASIEEMAASFMDELRRLIEHCTNSEARGFTPSDFPLAHLNQAELDRVIEAENQMHRGAQVRIEDIYVLSPMQQGMLFHTLFEPEGGAYVSLLSWRVEGAFNVEAFAEAWQCVIDRHTILRTGFFWEELAQPVQVVFRGIQIQVPHDDWSRLSQGEQVRRLKDYHRTERARGFKLQEGLLMRVAVMRVAESGWQVVWTHHHLLTDGWSLSLVLKEVFDAYLARVGGRETGGQKGPAYREYIEWLAGQDLKAAEGYWRKQLAGFRGGTGLVASAGRKT
ncbi:MAG TPA: amino acid adenylation domain-containing protein, partial [Pyrinomonadaceae bacterium]|nr:amino acid adenylation domain-containing protein [Pyrinomonadaceae bacterium]